HHLGVRHHDPRGHGQPRGRARRELPHQPRRGVLGDAHPLRVAERHRLRRDDRHAAPAALGPARRWGPAMIARVRVIAVPAALVVAALLPALIPHPFILTLATQAMVWALLAAGWELLRGYTGQGLFAVAGCCARAAYPG